MYRLLHYSNNNMTLFLSISHQRCIHEQIGRQTNYKRKILQTQVKFQSTHPFPKIDTSKVRKRRAKKSYTDMLIGNRFSPTLSNSNPVRIPVSDSSASEVRARVHNLPANDVKLFALTNLNLNEVYKLKDYTKQSANVIQEHAYYNLVDFPIVSHDDKAKKLITSLNSPPVLPQENLNTQFSELEAEDELESDLHQTKLHQNVKIAPFQPEIVEEEIVDVEGLDVEETTNKEQRKRPKCTMARRARETVIARNLAAYIEVCGSLRNPQRGFNAFQFYRHRSKLSKASTDRFPPIRDVSVYNALLKGFAAKGDFRRLQEIIAFAKEEAVELDVQSYAAIFECLGRVNFNHSHTRFVRVYAKEALRSNITFQRILNEATFLQDQRENVVQAMQTHELNFVPVYDAPNVQYDNRLVNSLNHDDQLRANAALRSDSGTFSKEMLMRLTMEQLDIERNVSVKVRSIEEKPAVNEEVFRCREVWNEHLRNWETAAGEAFNRHLMALSAQRSAVNPDLYLRCIPSKDIIAIIVDEAQKIAQGSETYSPTTTMLYRELGAKLYARFKVHKKQKTGVLDKILKVHADYLADYAAMFGQKPEVLPNGAVSKMNSRQKWQYAEFRFKHEGATIAMDHQEWTPNALITIGKFLYKIIMHDLKVDVNALRTNCKHKNYLPAFYTIFRTQGRAIKEEVKPHPVLSKLYRASVPETLSFPAYELPMRCPPVPWTSVVDGGYVLAASEFVRLPSMAVTQKMRLRVAPARQLYPTLDSLNQLAAVPWKVNVNILDIILAVFRKGGSVKLNVPKLPALLSPPENMRADLSKTEKHAIFRQRLQHRRKKAEMYSLWCDCLYRLSVANHFRNDVFWLPHNMDFRGRVYPIPPHLNHLGSDLARSMLMFAEARPLGPNGLDWLKLHLVNLTGKMKRDSLAKRLEFANSIMDKIIDSADSPLTGQQWWSESDEPWQTLACCIEIAAASRSSNPEAYETHFPVHQDGSCNGLQHYAALGRDEAGAFSVNLCSSHVPQDVYSTVASMVETRRQKDAENGMEIAKVLENFVKRKVIKQTVMTTVYGVTRFGARLQIARQLKDIEAFPKEFVWAASSYLTARTFESLQTMFTSTREIQDWFTECARLIASVSGHNVEWVTPLGFPVVQPYLRYKRMTRADNYQVDTFGKPNVQKQKNAFPPNFIHSLDSSHMMLTSLHCERAGISFVSVHDCYWTHPSTVPIMNKICREQFVALHSDPILEELSNLLTEKYSYEAGELKNDGSVTELTKLKLNRVLRKLPKTGDFDINEVMESVYFFS